MVVVHTTLVEILEEAPIIPEEVLTTLVEIQEEVLTTLVEIQEVVHLTLVKIREEALSTQVEIQEVVPSIQVEIQEKALLVIILEEIPELLISKVFINSSEIRNLKVGMLKKISWGYNL